MAAIATGQREDALDIVQDAMLKLVQRYAGHAEQEWGALFHRILQSRIRDWYRRHLVRNRLRVWFGGREADEEEPLESSPAAASDGPLQQLESERFGMALEDVSKDREGNLAAARRALAPFDDTLGQQDWFGGDGPSYADYLVFGAFQWARAVSPVKLAEPGSPLSAWNERMLDLFGGVGRTLAAVEA